MLVSCCSTIYIFFLAPRKNIWKSDHVGKLPTDPWFKPTKPYHHTETDVPVIPLLWLITLYGNNIHDMLWCARFTQICHFLPMIESLSCLCPNNLERIKSTGWFIYVYFKTAWDINPGFQPRPYVYCFQDLLRNLSTWHLSGSLAALLNDPD